MKTVLVLVVAVVAVATSQGVETLSACKYPEMKEPMNACIGSCSKDDQVIANWRNLVIGTTPADECLVKCCWTAVGVINKTDGSINLDNLIALNKKLGVEVSADDQEQIKNYKGDMAILVKKFNGLLSEDVKKALVPCFAK